MSYKINEKQKLIFNSFQLIANYKIAKVKSTKKG